MSLKLAIDQFWDLCRSALGTKIDISALPDRLSNLIEQYSMRQVKKGNVELVKTVDIDHLDPKAKYSVNEKV